MLAIGLRYCGGCNPQIDRSGIVNDLRENLRTMGLEADLIPEGEKPVDVVLLVNGCRHACLEKEYPESGRGCPVISLRGEMVDDQDVAEGDIVKVLIARLGSLG